MALAIAAGTAIARHALGTSPPRLLAAGMAVTAAGTMWLSTAGTSFATEALPGLLVMGWESGQCSSRLPTLTGHPDRRLGSMLLTLTILRVDFAHHYEYAAPGESGPIYEPKVPDSYWYRHQKPEFERMWSSGRIDQPDP